MDNNLNEVSKIMVISFFNFLPIEGSYPPLEWGFRDGLLIFSLIHMGDGPRVYPSDSEREFSSPPSPDAPLLADESASELVSDKSD